MAEIIKDANELSTMHIARWRQGNKYIAVCLDDKGAILPIPPKSGQKVYGQCTNGNKKTPIHTIGSLTSPLDIDIEI